MGRSRSLIQFIDSLFYETTVTTKRTITRKYYDPGVCNQMRIDYALRGVDMIIDIPETLQNQDVVEELGDNVIDLTAARMGKELAIPVPEEEKVKIPTEVITNTDHYVINGKTVPIPDKVRNKPPLIIDGRVNHQSFPDYRHAKLAISYIADSRRFASFDGSPLGRTGEYSGWSRKDVFVRHATCTDMIQTDPQVANVKANFQDLILSFAISDQWGHLSIVKPDGSVLQIYQDNIKQFDNDGECVILAHAYARAALLTYDAVRESIEDYNEENLAVVILAMFVADRA